VNERESNPFMVRNAAQSVGLVSKLPFSVNQMGRRLGQ